MINKFLIRVGTCASALLLTVNTVFAAVGMQNPNLTVNLSVNPQVVSAGDTVTVNASVTNNTKKTIRVSASLDVVSPSAVVTSYPETYTVASGQTASEVITYVVPAGSESGTYSVTLSATDRKGTSSATEYVTVQ